MVRAREKSWRETEEGGRKRTWSGVQCSRGKEEMLEQAIGFGDQQVMGDLEKTPGIRQPPA